MRFEGRIRKDGRFWLVEIPAFDAVTQGRTKREAFAMAEDLIETMADAKGFRVTAYPSGGEIFEIEANSVGTLIALLLRRQRERHGLTLSEAAERLGQCVCPVRTGQGDAERREAGTATQGNRPGSEDRLAHRGVTAELIVASPFPNGNHSRGNQ